MLVALYADRHQLLNGFCELRTVFRYVYHITDHQRTKPASVRKGKLKAVITWCFSASDKQSKKPEVDCFNNSLELLKGRLDNTMDRFTRPDVDGSIT